MENWLKTGKLVNSKENCSKAPAASTEITTEWNDFENITSKLGEKSRKRRKYDEYYLNYGFTWTGDENEPNGLCVECE